MRRRCLSREGLSRSCDRDALRSGHGAASPISLRYVWCDRDWDQLAIALPVDAGTGSASGSSLRPHDLSGRRQRTGADVPGRCRQGQRDHAPPHPESRFCQRSCQQVSLARWSTKFFRRLPTHSRLLRCVEGSGTYGSRRRLADWFGSGNGGSCATRRRRDRIRQPIVGT